MRTDELLRRLALHDPRAIAAAIGGAPARESASGALGAKTTSLVRVAALLSVGAATISCRAVAEEAHATGATDEEIVGVLLAIGPAIGAARLVEAAPRLALALDFDVDDDVDKRFEPA
jgi:alkylhydroperoxidase/carboxymuconolactone decarboxylase family protein YurZ